MNLYLDINETGGIKINFPSLKPHQMEDSCALDVAARDGQTMEQVGTTLNIVRERVRQIESAALKRLREHAVHLEAATPPTPPEREASVTHLKSVPSTDSEPELPETVAYGEIPAGWISTRVAATLLDMHISTVGQYASKGVLERRRHIFQDHGRDRPGYIYLRSKVEALQTKLGAVMVKQPTPELASKPRPAPKTKPKAPTIPNGWMLPEQAAKTLGVHVSNLCKHLESAALKRKTLPGRQGYIYEARSIMTALAKKEGVPIIGDTLIRDIEPTVKPSKPAPITPTWSDDRAVSVNLPACRELLDDLEGYADDVKRLVESRKGSNPTLFEQTVLGGVSGALDGMATLIKDLRTRLGLES